MNTLQHLPEDIRSEFSVNGDGQAFATRRAIARLAGVSLNSIQSLLLKIADQQNPVETFETFIGQSFDSDQPIPDTLVSLILEYYAYECHSRYRSQQAKQVCRVFRSIGFRVWVQNELNWQQPKPRTITPPSSFDALEYAKKALSLCGLESPVVESWGLVTLASKIDTANREIYLDAQKLIASSIELPETLSTVTEVCSVYESDGVKMTARDMNKMLCKLGLQVSTRDAKGRIQYQLTESGDGLGKLTLTSTSEGKNVAQLKWYANKLIRAIGDRVK
jgi:hypothetical protein